MRKNESGKLKISLVENGLHSLRNGITSFDKYIQITDSSKRSSKNRFLLRDSVMSLHHGIELLMKEVLVRKSEFLIFEKLDDAAAKQKSANAQGIGIFSLENPPRTVTYEEAINRVEAFIKPEQLTIDLRKKLSQLNLLRNQLEHYAIDINESDIVQLISGIREPLIELLNNALGKDVIPETHQVKEAWTRIGKRAEYYKQIEGEVFRVLPEIGGKTLPGYLLDTDNEVTLPKFLPFQNGLPDLSGEIDGKVWQVELWTHFSSHPLFLDRLERMKAKGIQIWIIIFGPITSVERAKAKKYGAYITDLAAWEKIKGFIPKQGSLFEKEKT